MKFLNELHDGETVRETYLCRQVNTALTKNGKEYLNVILADKTGTIDAKVWSPNSAGIENFSALDYVEIYGKVSIFNDALQISIDTARKVSEVSNPNDYYSTSEQDIDEMYEALLRLVDSVKAPYYKELLKNVFLDESIASRFKTGSAAKSVHHAFVGGLLEHSLSVATLCDFYAMHYNKVRKVLNRDLLVTAALLHDIGKLKELAPFPVNDYTDEGNLLGHIYIGAAYVHAMGSKIPDFPPAKLQELEHCILAHHGKMEFGSPRTPGLIEAIALSYADDTDAKIETAKEALDAALLKDGSQWVRVRMLDTQLRPTSE